METKVCTICKTEKDISNFSYRDKSKNKFQSNCKECQKEYDKNHYFKDSRKKSIRMAAKKYSSKSKDFVNEYKKTHKCIICGEDRWYVLEFHHKSEKIFNLANAGRNGISVTKLKEEIDKCDILCANCHRELHHKEKQ